jgi:hypothetical protein
VTEPTSTIDADEAAFLDLHAQREDLERQLSLVQLRRQFGPGQEAVDQAAADEQALLLRLDRVLTQIRAAEYKRQPNARRW